MKLRFFFCLTALFGFMSLCAQGYRIKATMKNGKGYLYLGYYFGEMKYLQDSALLDKSGTAVFEGKKNLPGGLYILVDPDKARFFDVVIDKNQHFSVSIDTSFSLVKISDSKENDELQAYQKINNILFKDFEKWREDLKLAKTKEDSLPIQKKMNGAFENAQKWRDSFIVANPDAFLSLMFRLMREPEYKVEGSLRQDTLNAVSRYKEEYWKDISYSDIRLLRTPVFESRLMKYMEQVVFRHPDSLKLEIDRFILYSRTDTTMFKYYISRFTNEYMASKYMGLDVVFLHLFQKYYLSDQVTWLNEKDSILIYNRAYNLMGNIVGEPAAELALLDKDDRPKNLYGIVSPYTLVVFWDPDCGHCREQVPLIDSLYKAGWNKKGIKLVGVLVDTIRTDQSKWPAVKAKWTEYINEHKLTEWVHLYQPFVMREEERRKNIPNFRQNYDVYQTPTIYLLDKEKRIIAKKITPEQVQDFIEFQETQSNTQN
jgi:thiol-disulfide isomerase/thioredoxin